MQQSCRHVCALVRLTALLLAYALVVTSAPPGAARAFAETKGVAASALSGDPAGVNSAPAIAPAAARRRGAWRDDEVLVRFRDGATSDAINSRLGAAGLRRGRSLWGKSGVERLALQTGQDPRAVAEALKRSPEVAFAEPNYVIRADQVGGTNDPRFPEQWALRNAGATGGVPGSDINVAGAWPMTRGSARTVVAVLDSGVDSTHPDLAANRWINQREKDAPGDDDGNGLADDLHGWDWVDNTGGGRDPNGHGTAVAGLIAAAGNNGAGVAGVMWRAGLMSLRVLDHTGAGDVAAAVQAIDYAVENGARIVNCSWGTGEPSVALKEAVERAAAREVLVVASAGNDGRSLDSEPRYPAGYELPNVVAVAATDNSDRLAPLSNYGAARVHVAAPGQDVLTTRAGGDYSAVSGTSAAAALVTGVAGLIKTVNQRLTAAQVRESITRGARPVPALSELVASGGVLNAGAAFGVLTSIAAGRGRGGDGGAGSNNGIGAPQAGSTGVGNGRAAELSVRPLAPTRSLPQNDLPNLDELRTRQHQPPRAPSPVPSDRFSPGDGPRRPRASNPVTVTAMLAGLADRPFRAVLDGARAYPHAMPALDFYRDGGPYAASDTGASFDLGVGRAVAADAGGDTTAPGTQVSAAPLSARVLAAFQSQPNNATFSGQSVPASMVGGQGYSVSVTMTNTGSTTWNSADLYRLGAQNPQDNSTWGASRIHLTAPVAPGQSATFNFTVVAPQSPGTYHFQWRMVRDGVEWFGAYSTSVAVSVAAPGAAAPGTNLAAGKPATQSSTVVGGVAARAVDGNADGNWYANSVTHTDSQYQSWWQVDLGDSYSIQNVKVWNRTDCCGDRLSNFYVLVSDSPFASYDLTQTISQAGVSAYHTAGQGGTPTTVGANRTGRYVRVQLAGTGYLSLAEVEVVGTLGAGGGMGGAEPPSLSTLNRVGEPGDDLLSRNFNWSVPLVTLKGRSGLDLGLALSYNSLVWTRAGSTMVFDGDRGDPTPGFRLGFPVVQALHYNPQAGRWGHVLILPSGRRVELRQSAPSSSTYDAVDSSNLRLVDVGGGSLHLWTPDGTRLTFAALGGQHRLTEIKDRNGNYITAAYDGSGRLSAVTDTLGRVLTFNYDNFNKPISITQTWRREAVSGVLPPETHQWATFGYANVTVQTNFRDENGNQLAVQGPQNNTSIPALTQVGLGDGTRFNFDYTSWGQVYRVTRMTKDDDQVWRPRSHVRYDLPLDASAPRSDCPRFSKRWDWAEYWNANASGVAQEAQTTYSQWDPSGASSEVTTPDGTTYKEFYATSGWRRGLVTQTEVWAGGQRKKYTTVGWDQDSQLVSFRLNPRPVDVNVYDTTVSPARHRRTYTVYTAYGLPDEVYEFEGCCTVLRRTHLEYNLGAAYTSRRVIGLPHARMLYDGAGALQSRVEYGYDAGGEFLQQQGSPVRHDAANYGAWFVQGRGLLTSVRRYNVANQSEYFTSTTGYNTTGLPVFTRDPKQHQTNIGYADAFFNPSDPNSTLNHNTYAYPTTLADADGHSSSVQYYYEMGTVRRTQDPKGAAARSYYDAARRVERVVNLSNNGYTRNVYGTNNGYVQTFSLQEGGAESYSIQMFNGAGQLRATAAAHPNSSGGYSAQYAVFDVMGRVAEQSHPYEITASWIPTGDDGAGHHRTLQTYDWQGRPLLTTHTADGTTTELTYGGCGCAGGLVVTSRDEIGRRQRTTYDALGRPWKAEVLNMDGSVYSTTTNTYNGRDQLTRAFTQQGTSGTGQETLMTYDGHGRLATSKSPIQSSPVTYSYDTDDVILSVTDPRGVISTFGFTNAAGHANKRHLVNSVTRTNLPTGVPQTPQVRYEYDAAGNRTKMTDGTGSVDYAYNNLSQLTSETRSFVGLPSTYTVTYGYTVSGQLKYVIDPSGSRVDYGYDAMGRLLGVTGSGPHSAASYASNFRYRAWGALRDVDYGNGAHQFVGYNSRLRPAAMELRNVQISGQSSVTMAWSYSHYADGRVERSTDVHDGRFTRKLDYDHAGRLKEAYSGPEAVGQPPASPPNTSPFRQSFGYDVWGNMTYRAGRFWRHEQFPEDSTYANDRRQGWDYDAAGNVLTDAYESTYDAAGAKTLSRAPLNGCGHAFEIAQTYDGAGRPARREQTTRNEQWSGEQMTCATDAEVTYYVYAAALGGARLVELDVNGNKKAGYVYAAGRRLAKQTVYPYINASGVRWHHDNPGTTSWVETDAGRTAGREERDPLGADTGSHDPYIFVPDPNYGGDIHEELPLFSEGGNPFDFSSGCEVDGMPASCSQAQEGLQTGSTVLGLFSQRGTMIGYWNLSRSGLAGLGQMPTTLWFPQQVQKTVSTTSNVIESDDDDLPVNDSLGSTTKVQAPLTVVQWRSVSFGRLWAQGPRPSPGPTPVGRRPQGSLPCPVDPLTSISAPGAMTHYVRGSGEDLHFPIRQIPGSIPTPLQFPDIQRLINKGTGGAPFVAHQIHKALSPGIQLPGEPGMFLGRVTFNLSGVLTVNMIGEYQFFGSLGVNNDPFDFHGSSGKHSRDTLHEIANDIGELFPGTPFNFVIDGRFQVTFEGNSRGVTTSECR